MIERQEQSNDETAAEASELDETQLDDVTGGAGFLNGSLTAQQDAAPWINTGGDANGFIMKDSVIVRTGTR